MRSIVRSILTATLALSIGLPFVAPADAQTARLPRKSRAERQGEEINRDIRQEQELRSYEQQRRFDDSQLRQSLDRQRYFPALPPPPPPGARIVPCPGGRC